MLTLFSVPAKNKKKEQSCEQEKNTHYLFHLGYGTGTAYRSGTADTVGTVRYLIWMKNPFYTEQERKRGWRDVCWFAQFLSPSTS